MQRSFYSRTDLKQDIRQRISRLQELDSDDDEAQKLQQSIEYLSHKLCQNGIVSDDLTTKRYFLSRGGLLGGGPNSSKHAYEKGKYPTYYHSPKMLCQTGKNSLKTVLSELNWLKSTRNTNRQSRVIIINETKYSLYHKNNGSNSGYFFSDSIDAFQCVNDSLSPYSVGGFLHTKQAETLCGSSGYFSFKVPTPGKNYIVCCGFNTPFDPLFKGTAAIEIRGEDGVMDDMGRITGHGIDPTGTVLDIKAFVKKTCHDTTNRLDHKFSEVCRAFKVECRFTKKSWAIYYFSILPPEDDYKQKFEPTEFEE